MAAKQEVKKQAAPHKMHLSFSAREYFAANLALLLKSGVAIGDALDSLSTTTHSQSLKKALQQMQADIDAGYNLSRALERSGIASGQTLALVRLGESSGRLVENLELAAQQDEKRHTFHSKVRSALIYPAFVLSLTILVGLGVAWFLLPKLAATFSQLHVPLPFVSKVMIAFGVFLRDHGIVAVPIGAAIVGAIGYVLFGYGPTKFIGQSILFKIPGIGRLLREVEISQFGYLLGTLLNAGLSITQALNLLAEATSSYRYHTLYAYLSKTLDEGYSFKESLSRNKNSARLLPLAVQQMVIAGEKSGSLPAVLLTIGHSYEQKADITTANLEAIIEPVLLVVVWVGVMLVAVAVIVPIYSLVGGLK